MPDLLQRERQTYADAWTLESYREVSPGVRVRSVFLDMAGRQGLALGQSMLDAGCGSGRGALGLQELGYNVDLCDITADGLVDEAKDLPFSEACLWRSLGEQVGGPWDWAYCCDVLEHIPTPLTMLTVDQLLRVARRGVFLSICFLNDTFGLWIGKPLHQTVQPFVWWRDNLSAIGELVEARDMINDGAFLLRGQC